jgi:transposase
LLCVHKTVVESVEFVAEEAAIVVCVRPLSRQRGRCGVCRRRCPGYDQGEGPRRWRSLDLGTTLAYVQADAPRVCCREHGVVVAAVPWARHGSWFTRSFEDQVAWLTVNTSKTAVAQLMGVSWRAVGNICERVTATQAAGRDMLSGLKRLGFDEISVRKGQRYLTVVVDHRSGALVWAAPGRSKETVGKFLALLGEERCAGVELVSCDMADWIRVPVSERCPNATICLDPFHVIQLSTKALDEVRREVWNQARREGQKELARELKGARFALWKNVQKLTERQSQKLSTIQKTNKPLYRAYLLSQQLRQIYRVPFAEALTLLDAWLSWARRCRLAPFIKLAKTITQARPGIEAAIENDLSNARVEQVNTQIRLITRRGFGYHSQEAVIAIAMLTLGGLCPSLPAR